MIVRDRFTRLGRTASHLARVDTNKTVTVVHDQCRNLPPDIPVSLTILACQSRTNDLAKRHLLHFKMSPELENPRSLPEALYWIERVYGISPKAPRLVVRHEKGDRPAHYHVLYSIVDPDTGRAISSNDNYLKDEVISRILELRLGERVVPGTRHDAVVEQVAAMGLAREAQILAQFEAAVTGERLGAETRQHTGRTGGDAKIGATTIYECWLGAASSAPAFRDRLGVAGYDLVWGDAALVAVDRKTGAPIPIRRAINERSKAAGAALKLTREGCDDLFEAEDTLARRRADRAAKRLAEAQDATAEELRRLGREALLDGDPVRAARCFGALAYRLARTDAEQRQLENKAADELAREHKRLVILRQRRVDRAFVAAGLFDRRKLRKAVFVAAAASTLLAGGGLGLALVAGGVALSILPRREQARALALQAQDDRRTEARQRAGFATAARTAAREGRTRIFGERREALLTGIVFDLSRKARAGSLRSDQRELLREAEKCLGSKACAAARMLAGRKDAAFIGRQLRLRQPVAHMDRCEAARIFRARGRTDIADRLDPTSALIEQGSNWQVVGTDHDGPGENAPAEVPEPRLVAPIRKAPPPVIVRRRSGRER